MKAIPRRGVGRVSDWLGPCFFSEVVLVEEGSAHSRTGTGMHTLAGTRAESAVRILRPNDHARVRNPFRHSRLLSGTVTRLGMEHAQVLTRKHTHAQMHTPHTTHHRS
jgi:hypothetical protein